MARTNFVITYAKADHAWASWIAWEVETAGYTTFLLPIDSGSDTTLVSRMDEQFGDADRILVVLSPAYNRAAASGTFALEMVRSFTAPRLGVRVANTSPLRDHPSTIVDLVGKDRVTTRLALRTEVRRQRLTPGQEPRLPPFARPPEPDFPGAAGASRRQLMVANDLKRAPPPSAVSGAVQQPAATASATPPGAGSASGRVFISYRRQDTRYPAGWLYDRLAEHLGPQQIFKDVNSIEPGDDFTEIIGDAVGSCDVLLVLIGERWLTVTDRDGRRRLDNTDDVVRLEIETALERGIRVIPILVEGATMPRADELPASLAKLVRRQALELSDSRFNADTERLIRVLDKTMADAQARRRAGN